MKMPLSCGIDDWPGYISKEILEILVKYEILLNLDFMIQVCVDLLKLSIETFVDRLTFPLLVDIFWGGRSIH